MEELRDRTGASRTTLRIDDEPGVEFPVKAEALAPGINSIAGDNTIAIRASATFRWVDRERRILVQEDLLAADPAPAPELIQRYGGRAQMLAPVQSGGELVGLVSVHYAPGPHVDRRGGRHPRGRRRARRARAQTVWGRGALRTFIGTR
jgi:GAF domain-containing protein